MARRRKNYQIEQLAEQNSLGSVDDKLHAGDAVIADLLGEAVEENRQRNYLAQQLARFADIDASFERAGVPHQL